jgi:hypothetical protein
MGGQGMGGGKWGNGRRGMGGGGMGGGGIGEWEVEGVRGLELWEKGICHIGEEKRRWKRLSDNMVRKCMKGRASRETSAHPTSSKKQVGPWGHGLWGYGAMGPWDHGGHGGHGAIWDRKERGFFSKTFGVERENLGLTRYRTHGHMAWGILGGSRMAPGPRPCGRPPLKR